LLPLFLQFYISRNYYKGLLSLHLKNPDFYFILWKI